jgi:hypothetical protein
MLKLRNQLLLPLLTLREQRKADGSNFALRLTPMMRSLRLRAASMSSIRARQIPQATGRHPALPRGRSTRCGFAPGAAQRQLAFEQLQFTARLFEQSSSTRIDVPGSAQN